jgi:hypothetical protein
MGKETVKAVLIQRDIITFDVEIRDTTGRTRDLILGGRTFDSLKEAELFIRLFNRNQHIGGLKYD